MKTKMGKQFYTCVCVCVCVCVCFQIDLDAGSPHHLLGHLEAGFPLHRPDHAQAHPLCVRGSGAGAAGQGELLACTAHVHYVDATFLTGSTRALPPPLPSTTASWRLAGGRECVCGILAACLRVQSLGTDILPVEYGGSAAETPVEQAVQQLAAWRKQMGLEQAQPQEELAQEGAASLRVSRSSPTLAQAQGSC